MNTGGRRLPYPGLRAFTREESDLFFGRQGCIDDAVGKLAATRFLALVGAAGSGKSSLVHAGLIPGLEAGRIEQAGPHWLVADIRSGGRPIESLVEALARAAALKSGAASDEESGKLLEEARAKGSRFVVEWCAANLAEGANLLLLVDQFEELFQLRHERDRAEADALIATLLESARAPLGEARIYVAVALRSECLGAAALVGGLAEAVNQGLHLMPRMSRDEAREAIVEPATLCGVSIEPALVDRLLDDLASSAPPVDAAAGPLAERMARLSDVLPMLQHVLNWLWSIADERGDDEIALTLADYEALGGLGGALGEHGREILEELLPEHRAVASKVFRALMAGSSPAGAVRRPTEFADLVAIAEGDEIAVREIVEAFRAPGRNFLTPLRPTPLRAATLIDLSHESIVRQWDELASWLEQEIAAGETWRRVADAAGRHWRGKGDLLSGAFLESYAGWWERERPTAAWAKRYGGDFDRVVKFLTDSRRSEEAERSAAAERIRRRGRGRRAIAATLLILFVIAPLAGLAAYSQLRLHEEGLRADREAAAAVEARGDAESSRQLAAAASAEAGSARQSLTTAQQAAADATAEAVRASQAADEQRQAAEHANQGAEHARQVAEEEQQAAAQARLETEGALKSVEAEKQAAAQALAKAEAALQTSADERQAALKARDEAEGARQDAEEQRQAAIEARKDADSALQSVQNEQQAAQAARQELERAKALAETAASAEAAAREEAQRQSDEAAASLIREKAAEAEAAETRDKLAALERQLAELQRALADAQSQIDGQERAESGVGGLAGAGQ